MISLEKCRHKATNADASSPLDCWSLGRITRGTVSKFWIDSDLPLLLHVHSILETVGILDKLEIYSKTSFSCISLTSFYATPE